ncbi:MAG: hypothetical protein ABID38_02310 [Candidatus Diapherotrites archaeon]
MAKWKKFSIPLTTTDLLDVKLEVENGKVTGFALNYRTKIGGNYHEVYRVDTAHGQLHEQKYWISPYPIPLKALVGDINYNATFYVLEIKKNFERYKKYFLGKRGETHEV